MNDKSRGIGIIIIFGMAGLILLVAAWVMPELQSERVMATVGGVIGIGFAAIRGYMLRQETPRRREESIPVEIRAKE